MVFRQTARKATTPLAIAENAILAFRSYRPRSTTPIEEILQEFGRRWHAARPHNISDVEGIYRLLEVLPDEWCSWVAGFYHHYIRRRPDTDEEEGDLAGLLGVLHVQHLRYQEVMPASPDAEASHPFEWDTTTCTARWMAEPSHRYVGESSEPSRPTLPQAVRDFPRPLIDPMERGKAPAIDVPMMDLRATDEEEDPTEYEADTEAETSPPGRPRPRRHSQEPLLHFLYPLMGEFFAYIDRSMADVHGRLDALTAGLALPIPPGQDMVPPPPVQEDLPGDEENDPIILSSDTDPNDFDGCSGLSSVD